jgi:hypothetical protein
MVRVRLTPAATRGGVEKGSVAGWFYKGYGQPGGYAKHWAILPSVITPSCLSRGPALGREAFAPQIFAHDEK